ncbi:hypothetical protein N7445_011052 [Penicillium cf. griseofulvum]|nr:hypothetical protein N7445_011052 [Penicillium cf. griseofulvum]
MFPERYSCDRCRQQKVRCLKNWELSTAVSGGRNHLTPCERCIKADVPSRPRSRREKGKDVLSPRGNTHLSQHLSGVLSSSDVAGYDLNDLMMPSLDTAMGCMDDGDPHSWINNPDLTYNIESDNRTQEGPGTNPTLSRDEGKETLTGQLMKLSNRAMGATRELECAVITTSLTVNSPVVNEAFEAANTLVHIINSIPLVNCPYGSSQPLSRDGNERQLPTEYSTIFLALASYQHVLALFHAVCDFIKRSLGCIAQGTELQQQTLHGAGSSSAQFIMVLQLIMHLLNRIGRSLRMGNRENTNQHELRFGPGGGEGGTLESIVSSAQVMLRTLPDEHVKLGEVIQELQTCIEERVYV